MKPQKKTGRKPTGKLRQNLTITIPRELITRIKAAAQADNRSPSRMVEQMIVAWFGANGGEQ